MTQVLIFAKLGASDVWTMSAKCMAVGFDEGICLYILFGCLDSADAQLIQGERES